jgi:hypothetical protein
MTKQRCFAIGILMMVTTVLSTRPAHAQLVVVDPAHLVKNVAILAEAVQIYDETVRLRDIWQQFRQQIGVSERARWVIDETRWRTHGAAITEDPFGTYAPLGLAFDVGDLDDAAYLGSVVPLEPAPATVAAQLTPTQRLHFSRDYANVLMTDGFGRVAVQTTSAGRSNARHLLDALKQLQGDLLQPGDDYNGNIGLLQKVVGARLISARTTDLGNQLLSSLLEGTLAEQKAMRDAEAQAINADIYQRINGPRLSQQTTADTDRVLSNFWSPRP